MFAPALGAASAETHIPAEARDQGAFRLWELGAKALATRQAVEIRRTNARLPQTGASCFAIFH